MTLNAFDWAIIIIYLIGMIGLSFFFSPRSKNGPGLLPGRQQNRTASHCAFHYGHPVLNQQLAGSTGLCGLCRRRRDDLASV
jgi:hypothetical protein